ncbi:MAG: VWA domain-containing protein [Acidobacteriia bacterium]|nr:VWA domain-containing protein [Terriglobia bacterium]
MERNEVPVRVVVRDAQGKPVRNLTKDDFRILDDGEPQVTTQFSAEGAAAAPIPGAAKAGAETKPSAGPKIADRFVAFYFDDLVMKFDEIARSRDAATKYLQTSLQPADRVAIYTSSGQHNLDFTADRDKLQEALSRLHPIGVFANAGGECPDLSDYEAYMIDERKDSDALAVATLKVINCQCGGDSQRCKDPSQMAQFAARRRWAQAQTQGVFSLLGLEKSVRRLSILPGQRAVVFVSRGFISGAQLQMISEIIDRAVRAGVVVNGLDARGLYAMVPGGDASESGPDIPPGLRPLMVRMQLAEARDDTDVLNVAAFSASFERLWIDRRYQSPVLGVACTEPQGISDGSAHTPPCGYSRRTSTRIDRPFSAAQRDDLKRGINSRKQLRVGVASCQRHPHLAHPDPDQRSDLQELEPNRRSLRLGQLRAFQA